MQIDPLAHPTSPRGFAAASFTCGIKISGTPDLALLVSRTPARWAAAFTTNRVAAAPVLFGRELLASGQPLSAILVNSGNANACTGEPGLVDSRETATLACRTLGLGDGAVLVSSTGIIGVRLPMDKIRSGVAPLCAALDEQNGAQFARAIMTTDTRPKHAGVEIAIGGKAVRLGGCAKGAGMIHPRMATMLSYLTTDAAVEQEFLAAAFRRGLEKSFNRISVDGDTSTNDTCLILANGAAGAPEIVAGTPEANLFEEALHTLMAHLAREIVRDGEGATTVVRIDVVGALDAAQAETVARAIANSPLVKTAIHGRDPNWGRILCAAGYSGAAISPESVELRIQEVPVLRRGLPLGFDAESLSAAMKAEEVAIRLDLGQGTDTTTFWTCDFSDEYIRINADYHT